MLLWLNSSVVQYSEIAWSLLYLLFLDVVKLRSFFRFQPSVPGLVMHEWASGAMTTGMPQIHTAQLICATVSEAPSPCTATECSSVHTLFQHYQALNKCNLYWTQLKQCLGFLHKFDTLIYYTLISFSTWSVLSSTSNQHISLSQ